MIDAILDALIDGGKLLPFLFATYLVMEWIEHKTSDKTRLAIKNAGKWGPLLGGAFGVVPQCGFSTVAANLYAGKIISLGTLLAIFLSTSDEMLPIFLSEQVNIVLIGKILFLKMLIGVAAGYLIDLFTKKYTHMGGELRIGNLCEKEHCHCDKGLFKSAAKHTLNIFFFILVVSFLLNLVIGMVGEDQLSQLVIAKPVIAELLAGVVGLIPNCAASVVLTQLYLEGIIGFGAVMSGLLVGAGVGLLVLFKMNRPLIENIKITILLYVIGVSIGVIIDVSGFMI
ncbi:MAG: putative manganese transporter [Lachnospiraceae bacterium]|nr:putative manganese transporter [Lachnospiraceae bacterium]